MAFIPEELLFAPTGRCNLRCAHCRVSRPAGTLRAADAISLMESCRPHGIDRIGFSGGEPFLEPDFLCEISEAAVRLDFVFDRLMTNAVWYADEPDLRAILGRLFASGFDGTFGVSVDAYHGQDTERLALFFETAFEIWGRKDCAEISWVGRGDDATLFAKFGELARRLGGELVSEDGLPALIADPDDPGSGDGSDPGDGYFPGHDDPGFDDREALSIPFVRIPYSPPAESAAWNDRHWFDDDFCQGPGNVFYVHPDGRIAACCGFANENPELILGRLGIDDYGSLMRAAASNPHIEACYATGLATTRESLEARGIGFPGRIADPCVFCDYLCKKGLSTR